jgi:hypothetical protein
MPFLYLIFWFFVCVWSVKICTRSGNLVTKIINSIFDKLEQLITNRTNAPKDS